MEWYTCRSCKHDFHAGIFNIGRCPKCWNWFKQLFGVLKRVVVVIVVIGVTLAILQCAAPAINQKITDTAIAAFDPTMLYAFSKDAYLESIIRGRLDDKYYTIRQERPYYTSMIPHARVETTEPRGFIPANKVVELRSEIRRGEHVWIPASFYVGDKLQHAFVRFPREWDNLAAKYDWDKRVSEIRTEYENYMIVNYKDILKAVAPADEKETQEKYNDYYRVKEMSITGARLTDLTFRGVRHRNLITRDINDKNLVRDTEYFLYAPKTDKKQLDSVWTYYLNPNNISMVIKQTDNEWKRPEFVFGKAEEEK